MMLSVPQIEAETYINVKAAINTIGTSVLLTNNRRLLKTCDIVL